MILGPLSVAIVPSRDIREFAAHHIWANLLRYQAATTVMQSHPSDVHAMTAGVAVDNLRRVPVSGKVNLLYETSDPPCDLSPSQVRAQLCGWAREGTFEDARRCDRQRLFVGGAARPRAGL